MFRGKKYKDNAKLIDRATQYEVPAAMDLVVKTASAKFDETVEVHIKLGVDSRHADQQVRGAIVLPNGTGKTRKVLVFAKDAKLDEAKEAGADFVKTSTGYGTKGCTIQDLQLMRRSVSERVQVKGSGGIRDLDTVLSARAVGATRCGVSATAAIMAEAEKRYAEGTLQEVDTLKDMEGGY